MSKKQETGGNLFAYGCCKFCGQRIVLSLPEGCAPEDYTTGELNDMATGRCACDAAERESRRTEQEKQAVSQIGEVFGQMVAEDPARANIYTAQQAIITDAVKMICRGGIESAQIRMDANSSFGIGIKSNGNLRIRRTYKGTEEWVF